MNKLRSQYIYQLKGTIHSQQPRKVPTNPQHFYQLNILCETDPTITKVFVFKGKALEPIWTEVDQGNCAGQRYLFLCKNYRGYYQVINWEKLSPYSKAQKNCQYQAPNCLKVATYQHILKLGAVAIEKQWVCSNCKQELESQK